MKPTNCQDEEKCCEDVSCDQDKCTCENDEEIEKSCCGGECGCQD